MTRQKYFLYPFQIERLIVYLVVLLQNLGSGQITDEKWKFEFDKKVFSFKFFACSGGIEAALSAIIYYKGVFKNPM